MTSLGEATIATISAAVSTSSLSSKSSRNNSNDALNSNNEKEHQQQQHLSTKEIIQQKLKENENVLSIFEAYQIVGQHTSRILSLVVSISGGTYAVFSMTASRLPLRNCCDLTIDKVFPLNETFQIGYDKKGSISQLSFTLKNADETPTKYYYYPIITDEESSDFNTFQAQVISAKMSMLHTTNEMNALSFAWINDYRQIGEVKQEMKRKENEYIKYKDFTINCATYNVKNRTFIKTVFCTIFFFKLEIKKTS